MTRFFAGLWAAWAIIGISAIAAMLTHIIVCISNSQWLFLIAGAILPFIGVVHGYGVWFGVW